MSKSSIFVLIAMLCWGLSQHWLWCAVAAGEQFIHVATPELLHQNANMMAVQLPCNWDKNIETVKVVAFYISEQTPGTRPGQEIEVVDKRLVGTDMLQVTFDPGTYTFDGSPMHHADILVQTTGERCQSGFGFGTLTRPR